MFDLKPPYFSTKDIQKSGKRLIDSKPVEISKLDKQKHYSVSIVLIGLLKLISLQCPQLNKIEGIPILKLAMVKR